MAILTQFSDYENRGLFAPENSYGSASICHFPCNEGAGTILYDLVTDAYTDRVSDVDWSTPNAVANLTGDSNDHSITNNTWPLVTTGLVITYGCCDAYEPSLDTGGAVFCIADNGGTQPAIGWEVGGSGSGYQETAWNGYGTPADLPQYTYELIDFEADGAPNFPYFRNQGIFAYAIVNTINVAGSWIYISWANGRTNKKVFIGADNKVIDKMPFNEANFFGLRSALGYSCGAMNFTVDTITDNQIFASLEWYVINAPLGNKGVYPGFKDKI